MRRSNKNHPEHAQYVLQQAAFVAAYNEGRTDGPWSKSEYNLWSGYPVYHIVVGGRPLDWFGTLMMGMLMAPIALPMFYLVWCLARAL